jgi:hypothetical protein
MKRPVVTAVFLCALAGLAGCPIYDHENDGCETDSDCAQAYACNLQTGDCYMPSSFTCSKPSDCDATSTCTPNNQCMPGDCSFYNVCVAGYRCDSSTGIWECVANDSGAAGEAGATATGAGGASGATAAAGQPSMSVGAGGQPSAAAGGAASAQ